MKIQIPNDAMKFVSGPALKVYGFVKDKVIGFISTAADFFEKVGVRTLASPVLLEAHTHTTSIDFSETINNLETVRFALV